MVASSFRGGKEAKFSGTVLYSISSKQSIFYSLGLGICKQDERSCGFFPEGIKSKVRFFESGSVVGTVRIVHRRKRVT